MDSEAGIFTAINNEGVLPPIDAIKKAQSIVASNVANEVCRDAMAAKHDQPVLPHYLYEDIDKKTGLPNGKYKIDPVAYSDYLSNQFHVVNFKGILYIYDEKNHLYKQHLNEIDTHIRDTFVKYRITDKLPSVLKDVTTHLHSMGNAAEYPFNNSINTIPVSNGVVRIYFVSGDFELLPHGPEHLFTYKLNANFDPDAPLCPAIRLMRQWVDPEKAHALFQIPAQSLLQMQLGHPYKKAYLLQGEPNAGKSTYLDLLIKLYTDQFISSVRLQQLCKGQFVGGDLEGKLVNIYDDLEDIPLDTIDGFKTFTGSCTHGIERKHQIGYVGKVSAVHVFSCNYPPEYPDKMMRDTAFWERWEYLIFPNGYPTDPLFADRVFTDEFMSSFLNCIFWAMVHLKRWGLIVTSDVQTVMHSWSVNADPLFDFIDRCFVLGDGKVVSRYRKEPLYRLYHKFCDEQQVPEQKRKGTLTAFTTAIQHQGFFPRQRNVKKERVEVYESSKWKLTPNTDIVKAEDKGGIEI